MLSDLKDYEVKSVKSDNNKATMWSSNIHLVIWDCNITKMQNILHFSGMKIANMFEISRSS